MCYVFFFQNQMIKYWQDNTKLSKTCVFKTVQSIGFLGRPLGLLLKTCFPLMKIVLKPLAKSFLISLGLKTAASVADPGIHKKMFRTGNTSFGLSKVNNVNNFKWKNGWYHENS